MKVYNTQEIKLNPKVTMLLYGDGGVGKTTFATTAPKILLGDCEGGSKYLGSRGISCEVVFFSNWGDKLEFLELAKSDKYETIVIDPLNELMEKVMIRMKSLNNSKLTQSDGNPTMAGWGWLKTELRDFLKQLRDLKKHLILITHVTEDKDEDRLMKRPMLMTRLAQEVVNMVDIVGYMTVLKSEDGSIKRVIYVNPEGDKYVAKDRTGALERYNKPDFNDIYNKIVKSASNVTQEHQSEPKVVTKEPIKEDWNKMAKKAPNESVEVEFGKNEDMLYNKIIEALSSVKDSKKRAELAMKEIENNKSISDSQRNDLMTYVL